MLNNSINSFEEYARNDPSLMNFLQRAAVKTYQEFIEILYKDLDIIFLDLMRNPELRGKDDEDRLTIEIVSNLRRLGYKAKHDEKNGGHTDILVEKHTFQWIGEAKIDRGSKYIYKGFQQLSTRYVNAIPGQNHAGIIVYIRQPNMLAVMKKWEDYLLLTRDGIKTTKCLLSEYSFISTHVQKRSGEALYVRHMPISLYFNPEDR